MPSRVCQWARRPRRASTTPASSTSVPTTLIAVVAAPVSASPGCVAADTLTATWEGCPTGVTGTLLVAGLLGAVTGVPVTGAKEWPVGWGVGGGCETWVGNPDGSIHGPDGVAGMIASFSGEKEWFSDTRNYTL